MFFFLFDVEQTKLNLAKRLVIFASPSENDVNELDIGALSKREREGEMLNRRRDRSSQNKYKCKARSICQ